MAKNVGELNGKWAMAFRLALVLIPLMAIFQGWVVLQVIGLREWRQGMEKINPEVTKLRVKNLELEAARHGWEVAG